jgi:hypothetical protein
MRKQVCSTGLAILIAGLTLLPGAAMADVFMKQKNHTYGFTMMGQAQPARDDIQSIWITDNAIRNDGKGESTIIQLDKKTITLIDHAKKTYTVMPLNMDNAADAMGGEQMSKEDKKAMAGMMKCMMTFSLTVKETAEKKKINAWNCRKYIQKLETAMGPAVTDVWATEDIKVNGDIFARYSAIMMTMQPGLNESMSKALKETKKIKGVTVQTVTTTTMMGTKMKTATQLLEFKEGKAPATITAIPAGYRKQDMNR